MRIDVVTLFPGMFEGPLGQSIVARAREKGALDLNYVEDKDAEVDLNLVMTGGGQFVEVQGSGEEATFSRGQLDRLLKMGKLGIDAVTRRQRHALGRHWPLD